MAEQGTLKQIWRAIRQLNPGQTASQAERPFTLALLGTSEEIVEMRAYLEGTAPSLDDRERLVDVIQSFETPLDEQSLAKLGRTDFVLASSASEPIDGILSARTTIFDPQRPRKSLEIITGSAHGAELRLSLARSIPAFRPIVARRVVQETSRENAVFTISTALGHVIPNPLQPVISVAEAAGDMVFLTANQVRMLFMLGAIHGKSIGFTNQWKEIGSIVSAGFGWRSIARNLISKIPFGGGLVPKGAVAYAGTMAVGEGLIFFYATGRRMTRDEIRQAFSRAYSEASTWVSSLVTKSRRSSGSSGT